MEAKQKKVPAKRIQLVDVVLERRGSQLFSGRRVRSPEDAADIIRDFIGDSDREKFVVLGLSTKNEPQLLQVVHTGSINESIVHPREVMKALILSNSCSRKCTNPSLFSAWCCAKKNDSSDEYLT